MKNGMKLLAVGVALAGAALGVATYRRYKDSYSLITEAEENELEAVAEDADFEQVTFEEDDFTYYIEDVDQIMFYE